MIHNNINVELKHVTSQAIESARRDTVIINRTEKERWLRVGKGVFSKLSK